LLTLWAKTKTEISMTREPSSPNPLTSKLRTIARATLFVIFVAGASWSVLRVHHSSVSGDTSGSAVPESDDAGTPNFAETFRQIIDVDGVIQHPGAERDATAVVFVFLATQCPISNGILPELARLHTRFSGQIEFYGVIPDRFTTPGEAATHRREFAIPFPVLLDTSGALQRQLQPTHSPQAIVVDRDGRLIYSGRIDDRYKEVGRPKQFATQNELRDSLFAVVNGKTPRVVRTEPIGCRLELVDSQVTSSDVTFCREIAPIVFTQCTRCHRQGEGTPFPLETFEDVRRRASQIVEVVTDRSMPPWKPLPEFGHFVNEQRLTEDEVTLIRRWEANGAPLGEVADLPSPPRFANGWQLGEPDLILEMPQPFEVPADGPDIYQHFVLPTGLTRRGHVTACEFRPGDGSVVHHAWLYFDTSGKARELDAATPEDGYARFGGPGFVPAGNLGGWGPGGLPRHLPPGMARSIPGSNSDLVLQIHYHPTGKAARDRSRVGLYFAKEPVKQLVTQIMVADVDLEIPAGEQRHRFEASYTVPVETVLLDATPHMHLLGREVKVTATTPDGTSIPLIWIDDWNFFWQDHYVFESPVRLPAGSRIDLVAWYDNSTGNSQNPHSPPRTVRFGESSDAEMGICYFQATSPHFRDFVTLAEHSTRYFDELAARLERNKQADLNQKRAFQKPATIPPTPASNQPELPTMTNLIGMEFCRIPAGEFLMGSSEPDRFGKYSRSESPAHRARVSRPFWMARHEVTVGMFRRFVNATGYRTDAERDGHGCNGLNLTTGAVERRPEWIWSSPGFGQTDNHPVVCVTWQDAQAFCRWLSGIEDRDYRLPTEDEWEYSCRAGSQTLFSTGESISSLSGFANAGDETLKLRFPLARNRAPWRDGFAFTAPAGSFQANSFGLFDMHGNVGEWCEDWFEPGGYTASSTTETLEPSREPRWRVVRGGSWFNTPTSCRSSGRHDGVPTARSTTNGFRIARSIPD
jgi:formylglycine-generating enzyme required for sulfatase activity